MPERPLLVLPEPRRVPRQRPGGGPSSFRFPSAARQNAHIGPEFRQLQQAFASRRAELQRELPGVEPEKVLVIETIGAVQDFLRTVQRIPGLEWLAQVDEDDIEIVPELAQGFTLRTPTRGQLYLVMTNEQALGELVSLWTRYAQDINAPFPVGLAPWRDVFSRLHDVRQWSVQDRIADDNAAYWEELAAIGRASAQVEVELWYRRTDVMRGSARGRLSARLAEVGGHMVQELIISEIGYHAALVELPLEIIRTLARRETSRLTELDEIMLFRPSGQSVAAAPVEEPQYEQWPGAAAEVRRDEAPG